MASRLPEKAQRSANPASAQSSGGTSDSILQLLTQAGEPLSAYEVLHRLETAKGRKIAPPTVYRALESLIEQGMVARIESRSAYVACSHADHPHDCVFFVCDGCHGSTEIEDSGLQSLINKRAKALGFQVMHRVVELTGLCGRCQDGTPTGA
jgi:Fur family zinc uptake transcriptional regulator